MLIWIGENINRLPKDRINNSISILEMKDCSVRKGVTHFYERTTTATTTTTTTTTTTQTTKSVFEKRENII